MRPMLATRGTTVPPGAEWLHEVKWDGMRVLAEVAGGPNGGVRVHSRNENDVSVSFPELSGLSGAVGTGRDVLLDGEVVAFAEGRPSFAALAMRMHVSQAARAQRLAVTVPVTLLAFDVLRLDGEDLTGRPLDERRATLEGLGLADAHWQVPEAYDDGRMLMTATEQQGLEGVVSKRRASRYHPGRRSPDWLKFPHRATGSYVVGGWRRETDSDTRIGAVLVGEPTPEGLRYRGRVGSGIAGRSGQRLLEELGPLAASTSPFMDPVPRVDAVGSSWVHPELVVEVASLGLTSSGPEGRLRQPAYLGIRADLSPADLGTSDLGTPELGDGP